MVDVAPAPAMTNADYAREKSPYYAHRIDLFDKYYARELTRVEEAKARGEPIVVTLPDGAQKEGTKFATTPFDIALGIHKKLAQNALVAKVDGEFWDMKRPLEGDCALALFTFDDVEGKECYWHSSGHVLGESLELEYGADLTIGPAIEEGFYYDCFLGERTLTPDDSAVIKSRMEKIISEKQEFQRIVVSRAEALEMFEENKFKIELISALPEDATISCYRCGPMVDLCRGPHLPDTGALKSVNVTMLSLIHI